MPANSVPTPPRSRRPVKASVRLWPGVVFLVIGGAGVLIFAVAAPDRLHFWNALVSASWAAAAGFASAGFLAFLFSYPGALRAEQAAHAASPWRSRAEATGVPAGDLSDWLGKILVGAALTQVTRFPGWLRELAAYFAGDLPVLNAEGQLMGLLIYFAVAGGLWGHLFARMIVIAESAHVVGGWDAALELKQSLDASLADPVGGEGTDRRVATSGRAVTEGRAPSTLDRALREARRVEEEGLRLEGSTYEYLALELERAGCYAEAVGEFRNAFEAEPSQVRHLNSAGVLESADLGRYDVADALFKQALARRPEFAPAVFNMACNEARRGRLDSALGYLHVAVAMDRAEYGTRMRQEPALAPVRASPAFKAWAGERVLRSIDWDPGKTPDSDNGDEGEVGPVA